MKVVILEDDKVWQNIYQSSLSPLYTTQFFDTVEAFDRFASDYKEPYILIADLSLPDQSFLTYLKNHHKVLDQTKIIVISTTDNIDILEECYDLGIVDYLTKPINVHELIVKTRRLVDIVSNKNFLGLQIDRLSNRVSLKEHEIQLTPREFQIVSCLIDQKESGLHRDELLKRLWKNTNVTPNTIEVHICNLRKKLESLGVEIKTRSPHTFYIAQR